MQTGKYQTIKPIMAIIATENTIVEKVDGFTPSLSLIKHLIDATSKNNP